MPVLRGLTELEAQALGLPTGSCEITSVGVKTATSYSPGRWRGAKTYLLPPDPANPGQLRRQMHIGRDVHYQDDDGNWRTIDLNWQADPANPGEFVTEKNDIYTRVTRFGVAVWDRKRKVGVRWSTTVRPTTSGRQASFPKDGLNWTWSATTSGLKLESEPVASPRGPQTYEWRYLVIDLNRTDGFNLFGTLAVDSGGNLVGDGFTTPRAFVIGANRVRYECGPWQTVPAKTRAVSFAFDDSTLPPEAYPYTIDPTTTFGVAVSADDGFVERSGAAYPPTSGSAVQTEGTFVFAGRYFEAGAYYIDNGLMRWNTSIIPDTATVNSATLRVNVAGNPSVDARNLTADWYPGTSWPIDVADYSETAQTTALAGTSIASITTSADNNFVLTGAAANVSLTGYTGLRLHVSGGQPTGYNFVQFASFDHTTALEPRLIIDYTDGAVPTPVPLDLGAATIAGVSSIAASLVVQVPLSAAITGTSSLSAGAVVLTPFGLVTIAGVSSIAATLSTQTPSAAVIISDLFNRADSTTTLGVADTGQAWTALRGVWGISANQAYTPNNVDAVAVIDAGVTDATVQMTLPVANSSHYVVFRCVDADNFLAIMMPSSAGNYALYKREAGAFTALAQATGGSAAGDTISVVLAGSSITVKRAGTTLLTATSTLFQTATRYGMATSSNTRRFDSFSVSTTSTANPLNLGPVTVAGVSSISAILSAQTGTVALNLGPVTIAGTSTVSAALVVKVPLSAGITGTSTLSAGLVLLTPLPAVGISATSSLAATLSTVGTVTPVALAATIAGTSGITATLAARVAMQSAIAGASSVTATLSAVGTLNPVAMAAAISATSGLTAGLVVRRPMTAQISGTSAITAIMASKLGLTANIAGISAITATPAVRLALAAAIAAQSSITALLNAGTITPVALSAVITATSGLTATLNTFRLGDALRYVTRITPLGTRLAIEELSSRLKIMELRTKWEVTALPLYTDPAVGEILEMSIQFSPGLPGVTLPTSGVTASWRLLRDGSVLSSGSAVIAYGASTITVTAVVTLTVSGLCRLEYTVSGIGNETRKPALELAVNP